MNSAIDAIDAVSTVAERIKNDEVQKFPEAASAGDYVRQGDIYITLLSQIPEGAIRSTNPSAQVAPGNTKGSRHCIKNLRDVRVYMLAIPTVYDGPVIEADCSITIEHPEHGDWILPAGRYAISYQRTEDSVGRRRRVKD